MLGDLLFEAIQDIEFYQEEYPQLYAQYREEIERLKDQMRRLQTTIETPPGMVPQTPPQPPLRQLGLKMTGFYPPNSGSFGRRSTAQTAILYYTM